LPPNRFDRPAISTTVSLTAAGTGSDNASTGHPDMTFRRA
jgi:hypothetical protein